MTENKINVSIGTVGVLGLTEVPMETAPTTAYLMLGGRCALNCSFCAQARESESGALQLSRVTWPEYDLETVIEGLTGAVGRGEIKRACLQVTVGKDSFDQTLEAVKAIKRAVPDLPVDAAVLPRDFERIEALLEAGVDHIGIGLDAANQSIFERVKGDHWARIWSLIEGITERHPGQVSVHIIVGLGETERDVVDVIQHLHDLGTTVGLFAFTPVRGTPLQNVPQPPLDAYRRMQAAHYLICERGVRMDGFDFSSTGRLLDLGVADREALLADGRAFQTSGCPDCNRPFYNERPGGVMYNFPRSLTAEEVRMALDELRLRC